MPTTGDNRPQNRKNAIDEAAQIGVGTLRLRLP